jgi:hypothetical protein
MPQLLLEAGVDSTLLVSIDADTRELHPELTASGPTTTSLDALLARAQRCERLHEQAYRCVISRARLFAARGL